LLKRVKSMSKSVEAKFIWNKEVALLSSELFYKYEFRHSYRRYIGWIFIAMAQFGVVGALKHDAYGMLIVSSFLLLYWYVIRWQLRKRLTLRLYNSSVLANQNIITLFDAQGMKTGEDVIAWSDVYKVVEKAEGFLFYTTLKSTFFPKEAFSSPEDREHLRALIQKHNILFDKEQ